jgi:hypothetical protein
VPRSPLLALANPAAGWPGVNQPGVNQLLDQEQFDELGPFSAVWFMAW